MMPGSCSPQSKVGFLPCLESLLDMALVNLLNAKEGWGVTFLFRPVCKMPVRVHQVPGCTFGVAVNNSFLLSFLVSPAASFI